MNAAQRRKASRLGARLSRAQAEVRMPWMGEFLYGHVIRNHWGLGRVTVRFQGPATALRPHLRTMSRPVHCLQVRAGAIGPYAGV